MMKKLPPILKNKYAVALIVFFVWLMFFDRKRIINQVRLVNTLHELKDERNYYNQQIEQDSAALYTLESDKDALERFAREKYLMKRDNEDVYIVVDKE